MVQPVKCKRVPKHFGGPTHYSQTTAEISVVSVRMPSGTHEGVFALQGGGNVNSKVF